MTYDPNSDGAQVPDKTDLAAEYALGLLDSVERAAFEAELANHPELRAEVARWQEHFAALANDVEEVAPPASVLAALKQELWDENKLPWHRRLRIWEYALGAVAAALLTFAVYNLNGFSTQAVPTLQAQIQNEQIDLQIVLDYGTSNGLLRVEFSGPAPDAGRSYELWAVADGADPVSLGILPVERVAALQLSDAQAALFRSGVTMAISDEPRGGSPTGAPTGAVLGAGPVQVITNL